MSALAVSNLVLWVLVVVLALVVLALVRQVGVLHERITPVGALMLAKGLKVGEAAPAMSVLDVAGRSLAIGGTRTDGLSTLLMFVAPDCPVCAQLVPALKAIASQEAGSRCMGSAFRSRVVGRERAARGEMASAGWGVGGESRGVRPLLIHLVGPTGSGGRRS